MSSQRIYGNPDINMLLSHLSDKNGGMMDDTEKKNRFACWRLMNKMRSKFPKHDPAQSLLRMIDYVKDGGGFHAANLTSFTYLDRHFVQILNDAESKKNKIHGNKQEHAVAAAEAVARRIQSRRDRQQGGGDGTGEPHYQGGDGDTDVVQGQEGHR